MVCWSCVSSGQSITSSRVYYNNLFVEIIQINREPKRKSITTLRWVRRVSQAKQKSEERLTATTAFTMKIISFFSPFVCTFCGNHCMDSLVAAKDNKKHWMRMEAIGAMIGRYGWTGWRLPGGLCVTSICADISCVSFFSCKYCNSCANKDNIHRMNGRLKWFEMISIPFFFVRVQNARCNRRNTNDSAFMLGLAERVYIVCEWFSSLFCSIKYTIVWPVGLGTH